MDISGLLDSIKKDLDQCGTYDRYPVRFMSMKYEEDTSSAIMRLQQQLEDVSIYDVQKILPHDDAWLNAERFMKAIKNLNPEKSFIIVGFSEYARFLSEKEFVTIILALLEFDVREENIKRRLYIPCFALYSMVKKTIKKYHRRINSYNPLLNETDTEDLPRIYFIDSHLETGMQSNEVENSSAWFGMWRNTDINTHAPIICSSPTLTYYYKLASPDNVYNIKSISSYRDMLQFLYGIKNLKPYKKDEEKYFKDLISLIRSGNDDGINALICRILNTQNIDVSNIYTLWRVNNTFNKWLIQNYILKNISKDSYLYRVMDTINDFTDTEFLENVYELIFELNDSSFFEERKAILHAAWKVEKDLKFTKRMSAYYSAFITKIVKRKIALDLLEIDFKKDNDVILNNTDVLYETIQLEVVPYLTYYSVYERQLIIWLYRMNLIKTAQLESLYPYLFMYVDNNKIDAEPGSITEKFNKYFELYRQVKCGKVFKDDYDKELLTWNGNEEKFYTWYMDTKIEHPEILTKKRGFTGNTYVTDGISAEYMGYIVYLLEERGYTVKTAEYAKSHLPSITDVAKVFYPIDWQSRWLDDFDRDVVHNGYYYDTPKIEKALTVINQLIDLIISEEGDEDFAITADHGATAGHRIMKKDKKYDFNDAEHSGRCYLLPNGEKVASSDDYLIYDSDDQNDKWIIALNEQSLYSNSPFMAHGGATLEEVLVPVIIAQKDIEKTPIYKVRPVNLQVSGMQRDIEVKIIPKPKNGEVKLRAADGTDVVMEFKSDSKTWSGRLKRGIEQNINVCVENQRTEFKTVPRSRINSGGDGFDE